MTACSFVASSAILTADLIGHLLVNIHLKGYSTTGTSVPQPSTDLWKFATKCRDFLLLLRSPDPTITYYCSSCTASNVTVPVTSNCSICLRCAVAVRERTR